MRHIVIHGQGDVIALDTNDAITQIIELNNYEGIRDQDGWETLTLTVHSDYPAIAKQILDQLKK